MVISEIKRTTEQEYKIMKTKIEPVLQGLKNSFQKTDKDEFLVMSNDDYRLNGFIESIQAYEMELKQYFNGSNLTDYVKKLSSTFVPIIEGMRE